MAGKRHHSRGWRETLIGPDATPETLAVRAQRREKMCAALAQARGHLSPRLRRWLAAFELTIRWSSGEGLDMELAAQHLGRDQAAAAAALAEIREVFAAAGIPGFGIGACDEKE